MTGKLRIAAQEAGMEYRDFMLKIARSGEKITVLAKQYGLNVSRFYREWNALGIQKIRNKDFVFLGVLDSMDGHCRALGLKAPTIRSAMRNKGLTPVEALTRSLKASQRKALQELEDGNQHA